MNSTQRGYLYMLLSAASFASVSIFMKRAYAAGMTPWAFSFLQSALAVLQLAAMAARERSRGASPRPLPPRLPLLLFAVTGAGSGIAFNLSMVHVSVSLGTILFFTYPAFVALGAWLLLGERLTRRHLLALGLTLVGGALTLDLGAARGGAASPVGVGLALLAGVCQGAYIVAGDRLGGSLSPTSATLVTRAAIALGAALLHPAVFAELAALPARAWLITAGASVVGGVVPFFFLYKGIALIGATRAAIVSVVELPFALALGRLFAGDRVLPAQLAGALLVSLAVVLSQSHPAAEPDQDPAAEKDTPGPHEPEEPRNPAAQALEQGHSRGKPGRLPAH